jgi:hypothetical protein
MKFNDFCADDRPQNGLIRSQDGSKMDLKAFIFYHYFYIQFWFILSSILGSSGGPFGPPNRSKTAAKIYQKSSYANMPPRDHPKRPQDRPQGPPEAPERLQDRPKRLPRPSQEALRATQGLPRTSQVVPRMHPEALRGRISPPSNLLLKYSL